MKIFSIASILISVILFYLTFIFRIINTLFCFFIASFITQQLISFYVLELNYFQNKRFLKNLFQIFYQHDRYDISSSIESTNSII